MRWRNRTTLSLTTALSFVASGSVGGGSLPTVHFARFGAKTLAGAGEWKPVDGSGNPIDLISYDGLKPGSPALGAYVPSLLNGGLRFTGGGAGAPANCILLCTMTGGIQIEVTIGALVAGMYSVGTIGQADLAYENSVLGNVIELRAGHHNPTATRQIIGRGSSPAGTWTGTPGVLSDGNWVVLTREPGKIVKIGAVELAGNGASHPRYLRVHDLEFLSPLTADSNGFGPGGANGQINLIGGTHFAVTNCTFGHGLLADGATTGMFRSINSSSGALWIEGNQGTSSHFGFVGDCAASVIRRNVFKRVVNDTFQVTKCNNLLFEGNVSTDKLYGRTDRTITAISTGATTTFTVGTTSGVTVNDGAVLTGISGALGTFLNNRMGKVSAITGTTITLLLDSTGQPAWDGAGGIIETANALHGDHFQLHDDAGADNLQNSVTMRGNMFIRGNPPGYWPGGQGIFGGATPVNRTRDGWLIEGNIYEDTLVHGIVVSNLTNATVRSNTVLRQIGMDGGVGAVLPWISLGGTLAATNTLVDNIACDYGTNTSVTTNINNQTITIVSDDAVPAHATTIANYQASFANPPLVPGSPNDMASAISMLATRTDAGGAYAGFPVMPGATPYMNYTTLTYTNPR